MTGPLGVGVLVLALHQGRAQALLVAAVGQLAVELVHQVAAVGEDQDAAGARGLGEARRRPRSCRRRWRARTRSGGWRPGRPGARRRAPRPRRPPRPRSPRPSPAARPPRRSRRRPRARPRRRAAPRPRWPAWRRWSARPCAWTSAVSAISVPESASTWWADSVVPSTRWGSSSESRRSSPRIRENSRRHSTEGFSWPASSSASAASRARRRAVPGASAVSASSPSSTKGSRANASARFRSAPETGADSAREVLSAMRPRNLEKESGGAADHGGYGGLRWRQRFCPVCRCGPRLSGSSVAPALGGADTVYYSTDIRIRR